jgi:putative GTP pyrophosphokinase
VEGFSKSRVDKAGRLLAVPGREDDLTKAIEIVGWWRTEHQHPLAAVSANLFRYVSEEGDPVIAQRLKRVPTIGGKLHREKRMRLSQMEDIGGVRAVLPDQKAAYRVARRLRRNWTITRFRDYVEKPKPDGYRALHLVNRHQGRLIEIQLRTPRQDEWANAVEAATQRFPGLKFGGGPGFLREILATVSGVYAAVDGSIDPSLARLLEWQDVLDRANTLIERDES